MATLTIASNTNWSALEDTSSSNVSISIASKTFTVSNSANAWTVGMPIAAYAQGTNLMTVMEGTVTSYTGNTLVLNVGGFGATNANVGCVNSMWGRFANQAFSSSTVTITGSGVVTFQTRPNLSLVTGNTIRATNRTSQGTYIQGNVSSYNSSTGILQLSAALSSGSGAVSDWMFTMAGTVSSWVIAPNDQDVVNVTGTATLNIDKTNYGIPTLVEALTQGTIQINNTSTTNPIIFRVAQRGTATNNGKITVQQNANFITSGNYIQIATGNGSGLSYTFPSPT